MSSFGFFGLFEILFPLVFFGIFAVFIFTFVKSIGQWNKNNHSPRLTVDTVVVAKRTSVSHHNTGEHGMSSHTSYYVTFQVESGDRMELNVSGSEYGMLAEGDCGKLTFQERDILDLRDEYRSKER